MAPEIESVDLDRRARDSELAGVEEAFARVGFHVEARASVEDRGLDHWGAAALPWVIYVTLTVSAYAFFQGFLGAAGEDAWHAAKRWAQDVWAARDVPGNAEGTLNVRDPDGTRLILSSSLPEEALDALRDINWEAMQGGDIYWDADRQAWTSHDVSSTAGAS